MGFRADTSEYKKDCKTVHKSVTSRTLVGCRGIKVKDDGLPYLDYNWVHYYKKQLPDFIAECCCINVATNQDWTTLLQSVPPGFELILWKHTVYCAQVPLKT